MKNRLSKSLMTLLICLAIFGCRDKANEANMSEAEPAKVADASSEKYIVNVTESFIEWKGFKPTATHNGVIRIEYGNINTNNDVLSVGKVVIDMSSISVLDLEGDMKSNLENHLKGTVEGKEGDFFNVKMFPEAIFEITNIAAIENGAFNLSGNLTIKGVKNNITFPVKVTEDEQSLTINSEPFTIDRTKWGINFGSKSVFDNLGDKFINDEIELKITVKAKKE